MKLFLLLIKKVVIKIYVFGKVIRTTVVPMATKSYNQFKFLNLVTMATNKIAQNLFLMQNIYVLGKLSFRTAAIKSCYGSKKKQLSNSHLPFSVLWWN